MVFGWINVFGAIIEILMIIPNIVYAIKNKNEKNLCTNRFMNVIEQIGRYACIVFCGSLSLYGNSDLRAYLNWCFISCATGHFLSRIGSRLRSI